MKYKVDFAFRGTNFATDIDERGCEYHDNFTFKKRFDSVDDACEMVQSVLDHGHDLFGYIVISHDNDHCEGCTVWSWTDNSERWDWVSLCSDGMDWLPDSSDCDKYI